MKFINLDGGDGGEYISEQEQQNAAEAARIPDSVELEILKTSELSSIGGQEKLERVSTIGMRFERTKKRPVLG